MAEVPLPQVTDKIGEEIVDVLAPPVNGTEGLQLNIQGEFFDMFTTRKRAWLCYVS